MDNGQRNQRFFYGYVVVAAGFLIWFIGWGGYALCFGVFFKPLLAEFHWTRTETASAYAFSFLIQASMGIVTGWLTDKMGPRIIVALLGSCLGWSLILMSRVNTLWGLYMSYAVIGGIGASVLNIPVMATVSRWFVRKRGLVTGLVQAGAGVGGFILAPFTGWLILDYGWRRASLVLGLITAALMIVSGLFLVKDPQQIGQFPDGHDQRPAPAAPPPAFKPPATHLGLMTYIKTAQFWILICVFSSFGYFRSFFTAHMAPHVQDLGFSLVDGATIVGFISVTSIVGRVGMGRVADWIGNRRTLIISFVLTTLVISWLIVARNLLELYLFSIVYGFGWGALAVLRFSITAEVFGLSSVGLILGVLMASECVAATMGSYFGGLIHDRSGDYQIAFMICAALSFLGIILSGRLKKPSFEVRGADRCSSAPAQR